MVQEIVSQLKKAEKDKDIRRDFENRFTGRFGYGKRYAVS